MKVTGSLWKGTEWEEALNKHSKESDCYFEEVYTDENQENLIKDASFIFSYYRLMGYGNRFKRYTTKIPKKFYPIVERLKEEFSQKFLKVNEWGQRIKEDFIKKQADLNLSGVVGK